MKKEMKRAEALQLFNAIRLCENLKLNLKAAYALGRNLCALKPFAAEMENQYQPSQQYEQFDTLRVELVKQHQAKDADGNPRAFFDNNGREKAILTHPAAFEAGLAKLREQHQEAIEEKERLDAEYEELLNGTENFDLYAIQLEWLPENLTTAQMCGLMPLIKEHTKPKTE